MFLVFCGVCVFLGVLKICATGWFGSTLERAGSNQVGWIYMHDFVSIGFQVLDSLYCSVAILMLGKERLVESLIFQICYVLNSLCWVLDGSTWQRNLAKMKAFFVFFLFFRWHYTWVTTILVLLVSISMPKLHRWLLVFLVPTVWVEGVGVVSLKVSEMNIDDCTQHRNCECFDWHFIAWLNYGLCIRMLLH